MIISNQPAVRLSSPQPAPPPAQTPPPSDAFQSSPPSGAPAACRAQHGEREGPGMLVKGGRAAVTGGIAGTGLMIASAAGLAVKGALGGVLGPVVAAGIGALTGGVVATQRAKHRGVELADSTSSILTGAAAGAALGVAAAFHGTALPAWGLGAAGGFASELF